MKKLLLILCLFSMTAHAQSNLPSCTSPPFNNCFGTFTWGDGSKYVGEFKDDRRNGQGTFTAASGEKYVGQWKDDQWDGFGTFYNSNGSIFQQGLWRKFKFVQAQSPPVVPNLPENNTQDIKRQKCIRLGLAPNSADFQQCMN